MSKVTIEGILDNLVEDILPDDIAITKTKKQYISQATTAIKELIRARVPKKASSYIHKQQKVGDTWYKEVDDRYNAGCNGCDIVRIERFKIES